MSRRADERVGQYPNLARVAVCDADEHLGEQGGTVHVSRFFRALSLHGGVRKYTTALSTAVDVDGAVSKTRVEGAPRGVPLVEDMAVDRSRSEVPTPEIRKKDVGIVVRDERLIVARPHAEVGQGRDLLLAVDD